MDSLRLSFSARPGAVDLVCDPALSDELQRLGTRFVSGTATGPSSFRLELDDLLLNLYELSTWPLEYQATVVWDPKLRSLVQGNASDAAIAATILGDGTDVTAFDPAILGSDWRATFTDFQTRDIARLLSMSHGANFSVPGAGKTRVALAIFQARRLAGEVSRALVVCPKSAFESWQNENLECFNPPLSMRTWTDGRRHRSRTRQLRPSSRLTRCANQVGHC